MFFYVFVDCLSLYVSLKLQLLQDRDLRPEEIEGIEKYPTSLMRFMLLTYLTHQPK